MNYSNQEIIKRIKWAEKNTDKLTHLTDKNLLSTEDRLKIGLCKHFVHFANSRRILVKEISDMTGIPKTRLSEITNYKIKKFTVDKLIQYLTILAGFDSSIAAYLVLLEDAAGLPMMKVSETKKLSKSIRSAYKFA